MAIFFLGEGGAANLVCLIVYKSNTPSGFCCRSNIETPNIERKLVSRPLGGG
jgi:hypothetical protein